MKSLFLSLVVVSSITLVGYSQSIPVKSGEYDAYLSLNQVTHLPVHLSAVKHKKETFLVIQNNTERIELHATKKQGDTLIIPFPNFDSELRLVVKNKTTLAGVWYNRNRKLNNVIPFDAKLKTENKQCVTPSVNYTGKWETYFKPNNEPSEPAVGIFEQKEGKLTGTFLTETGDYRFLQGTVEGNKMYLSCFDGTHAFLFIGRLGATQIQGTFFSGIHYQASFDAIRNENYELPNADSLTTLKTVNDIVRFQFNDLQGREYTFPNASTLNKVVIIQIMGTWCPNCMDETNYYKELYDKYHSQGLEIISIGYEIGDTEEEFRAKIQRLKERKGLDFTFLVGGKASKALASEQFKMLNEIISFPTSIYIGRDGTVKRIHTGFNGPGTGSYYDEYVIKTNALIESLLAQ